MLEQIFNHQVPREQINGIVHLIKSLYSDRLETFTTHIETCTDPTFQTFLYLVVLNNEMSLQQYLLRADAPHEEKLRSFFNYLHIHTEKMLDQKLTIGEYITSCKEAWFLA